MNPRKDNWPALFNAYIEHRRDMPFAWGSHDCCMFAAEGVRAITGVDLGRPFRRRYKCARGAANVLRKFGGDVANIPGALGLPAIRPAQAGRGDMVCYEFNGRNTLGLCCGLQSVFVAPHGLMFVQTLACTAAWKI